MKSLLRVLAAGLLFVTAESGRAHELAEEMTEAANRFLNSLPADARTAATFDFSNDERLNWHFVPKARKGLPIKEMTGDQRALAMALLNSGLSHQGFVKATTIMSLEQILRDIEKGSGPARDPEMYFVSIFGKPEDHGNWAWRVEGHHLALNFTLAGGEVTVTPSFMGSNPGEVREGPRKGLRALGKEEDLGRSLVKSLDEEQWKAAVYTNKAPADIITGADRKARVLDPKGISLKELRPEQKESLWSVIEEYIFRARGEWAEKELAGLKEVPEDQIFFAWAGPLEPGQGHYYRVQGPTFLLEYDNTQNNANHVHAVWRDLKNDFGEDILREHYDQSHKK